MLGDDETSKSTQRYVEALENMLGDVGKIF
jgi:hypothetical protein